MSGESIDSLVKRPKQYETFRGDLAGTQFAEVEVDTETGEIRVIRMVSVNDCGFPVNPLTTENQVIGAPAYRTFETQKFSLNKAFYDAPDGYVFYPLNDDVAYRVLLDAFPDVEAFMVCSAYFKLTKEFAIAGFGTARVTSFVTVLALDRNRQVILRKSTYAGSDDTIKFALGGAFDASEILPLCVQATDKAARKFEAWFSKEMQK